MFKNITITRHMYMVTSETIKVQCLKNINEKSNQTKNTKRKVKIGKKGKNKNNDKNDKE